MDQQLFSLLQYLSWDSNGVPDLMTPQYRINLIDLIKFLLSENTVPISLPTDNTNYNANLFYHGWLYSDALKYIGDRVPTGLSLIKYPYIGLFHPFGSIHALNNIAPQGGNVPLNNFAQIEQHFHDALSPKTSFIHIDRNNDGKAYTVCIDWDETNRPGVRLARIRGIVTLLIYISNPYEMIMPQNRFISTLISNSFDTNNTGLLTNLVDSLSTIKGLYKILNTWEIDLFKNVATISGSRRTGEGLFLFDYRDASDTSRYYIPILLIKLDINQDTIPYINEIKNKLLPFFTQTIIDTITWEFEIKIVCRPP